MHHKAPLSEQAQQEIKENAGIHPDEEFLKLLNAEAEDDYPWGDCPLLWPHESDEPLWTLPDELLFF